jgi:hypothetical protein
MTPGDTVITNYIARQVCGGWITKYQQQLHPIRPSCNLHVYI